jgi:hypothetical protein
MGNTLGGKFNKQFFCSMGSGEINAAEPEKSLYSVSGKKI